MLDKEIFSTGDTLTSSAGLEGEAEPGRKRAKKPRSVLLSKQKIE